VVSAVDLTKVDHEVVELLRVVPRGTWGMCGLYECLRTHATPEQIDESLTKLRKARVIECDSIGSWMLIPEPRVPVRRTQRYSKGRV
jgi:hypothetical protein